MENVSSIKCVCKNVVRKDFDLSRNCYKYTATFVPESDSESDIFDESNLFAKEYLIPLRDSAIRAKNPTITAPVVTVVNGQEIAPAPDALQAWDKVVTDAFVGKSHIIHTITMVNLILTRSKSATMRF